MRTLIPAIVLALLCSTVRAAEAGRVTTAPDFAWSAGFSSAVRTPLKQAESKWNEAARVPASPDALKASKNKTFDETYLREIIARDGFAYDLLDVAMRKLKRIDECKNLYEKAVAAAGARAPAGAKRFDAPYYLLKSRIRLAIGLSRAQISREMAGRDALGGGDTSSYCFQAMEAAVDALRDAALDAENAPNGTARAKRIRELRAQLFETWEAAQRSKETELIRSIDLIKMWEGSGLGKQPDKK